jgi:hypothetical protein
LITLTDKVTNLPLYKATLQITAQKTQKTHTRNTTRNGTIVFSNLPEDVYEGTATETGYLPFSFTLTVLAGKTTYKTILLEPNPNSNRDGRNPKTADA